MDLIHNLFDGHPSSRHQSILLEHVTLQEIRRQPLVQEPTHITNFQRVCNLFKISEL